MKDNILYAVIPARGGSKSIPKKNLVTIGGMPLISYVIKVGLSSEVVSKVICSTDDQEIKDYCLQQKIEVYDRLPSLATDDSHVEDAVIHLLHELVNEGRQPEAIALLQPTSPFVRQQDIFNCATRLFGNKELNSVQTVTPIPHNSHAYNQRKVDRERVTFRFEKERLECFNKQKKPLFYKFGNLVVTRCSAILNGDGIFSNPSGAIMIPEYYSFDLDTPRDLIWGEFCISNNLVMLD